MKHKRIENKINAAMEHAFQDDPDRLCRILLECAQQEGEIGMNRIPEKKKKNHFARMVSAAAVVAVLALSTVFGALYYQGNVKPDSNIILDVNPSLAITLNKKEKVLDVTANNDDAVKILEGMNLKGSDLDVAVNALLGSLVKHGYIDDLANSILVTVENDNTQRSGQIQQDIVAEINRILSARSIEGAILSQNFSKASEDEALRKLADENQISIGKASLIQTLMQSNSRFNEKELAGLSINELNLLLESRGGKEQSGIQSVGSASDKAYIGTEKAKSIALSHAGIAQKDATFTKAKLDLDDDTVEYEVEFLAGGKEFEYSIDAKSGKILSYETEPAAGQNVPTTSQNKPGTASISLDDAKRAALSHAGLSASGVTFQKAKLDYEDGRRVYEIEFFTSAKEYDYTIDAAAGTVLSYEQERRSLSTTKAGSGDSGGISENEAKKIALRKAPGATISSCKLDWDDGRSVYEIELREGRFEYECKILKSNGTILKWEKELND